MSLPPIPVSPHFVHHDYGDGKPIWVFFPSGREFWSHDSNEPWPLEDRPEYPARLTPEQKFTVSGVAMLIISKQAALINTKDHRMSHLKKMAEWEKWLDE